MVITRAPASPRASTVTPPPLSKEPSANVPLAQAAKFPPAWQWLVDEAIPTHVKQVYSPKPGWKDKPFSDLDARFFTKGIEELSELFTEERPRSMPQYFLNPKYRSSYLLYFLPFQAAKFYSLFSFYSAALFAAVEHGKAAGEISIVDLGAGPGTASLAFLVWVLGQPVEKIGTLPPIHFKLFDTNKQILRDGEILLKLLGSNFPRLREKVIVTTYEMPWWKAAEKLSGESSLVILGNVLNEASQIPTKHTSSKTKKNTAYIEEDSDTSPVLQEKIQDKPSLPQVAPLVEWMSKLRGGGLLMVEPASRGSSQLLSKIRDELLKGEGLDKNPSALWGPCLHSFDCPLAQGRNYCHMSIPTEIPGKWFRYFSKALGSERLWLKFSFVWFSSPTLRPQPAPAQVRRVISDPIPDARSAGLHVLLCEPALPNTLQVRATHKVFRGDLVDFTESKSIVRNEAKGRNESQGRNDFQIRNESRVQAGPKILIRPKIKTRDRF